MSAGILFLLNLCFFVLSNTIFLFAFQLFYDRIILNNLVKIDLEGSDYLQWMGLCDMSMTRIKFVSLLMLQQKEARVAIRCIVRVA